MSIKGTPGWGPRAWETWVVVAAGSSDKRLRLPGVSERSRGHSAADMEPEAEPEPVTLLVKSPNQRHRDLELSGDRSWSVSRLKAHLSRVYPERPVSGARPPASAPRGLSHLPIAGWRSPGPLLQGGVLRASHLQALRLEATSS